MNSVKKNAALNIIKQICTIVFPLITFPYATRILHTENYGMFMFASSIISYISLFAGLGVNNYAVREGARVRNDLNKISNFVDEVFTINVISTISSYFILLFLIIFWKKIGPYKEIILILSIGIAFTTIGTDWVNVIFEDYTYITKRYIVCQFAAIILLFIIVKDSSDVLNYAFVSVFGGILANAANIIYIRKHFHLNPKLCLSKSVIVHVIPIFVLFANAVAQTIYINSDVTILGILKDDYAVGIYGVASRIYIMVKGIANAAIYVVIPRVASLISQKKNDEINNLYKKTLGSVIVIIVPAMVGLISLSRDIVLFMSGRGYTDAYQPLIILSCALVFATTACLYINGVLIPYRKEKIVLFLTVTSAALNIGLNFVLIPRFSYNAAAFTTLISEIYICVGGYLAARKICRLNINRDIILAIIAGIIVFCSCALIHFWVPNYILRIILSIAISICLYLTFMCIVKNNSVSDTLMQILRYIKK